MTFATRMFEAIGVLNKGSATTSAAPSLDDAGRVTPISSNSLNSTRVAGIISVIIGAGAAALGIFQLNASSSTAATAVAFGAVGLIVAAAVIAVAWIVVTDTRARTQIAITTSPTTGERHSKMKYVAVKRGEPVTITEDVDGLVINASQCGCEIELPDPALFTDRELTFERLDHSSNDVTIAMDGAFGPESLDTGMPVMRVLSNGTAWHELHSFELHH